MQKLVYVLNGPNLNLLGTREPATYGAQTLDDLRRACVERGAALGHAVDFFQSNAEHALIESVLAAKAYFADAYCAWQRGSNEQHNGLVRQYLPRRIALRGVNQEQIDDIEDKLNNRPRKTLGYRTPLEVFSDSFNCVALRS